MLTEFGKILRIIRINSGDSAREMAEKLNISSSYLSTIENGKRNIPPEIENLLIKAYNLSEKDQKKIHQAIVASSDTVKIDLTELAEKHKQIIFALSRGDVDEETVEEMSVIINKKKGTED